MDPNTRLLKDKLILCVGAGGIGCELLKNLVITGFKAIHVIDLDTIEVSNLNRQFLFRKEHVGKSKSQIAKESVLRYGKDVDIVAYHDTIISEKYGVSFFKQFDIVLNALDNQAARIHVNRMCLSANVPLIESGTAGYLGQVIPIIKGLGACFECMPLPRRKTYPACTIRNTPTEPIHCIIWAKFLFNQLFGEVDADEDVAPDPEDPQIKEALGENEKAEGQGDAEARESTRQWAERINYEPAPLLNKLYREDVRYLLSMKVLWENRTDRKAPIPLAEDLDGSAMLDAGQTGLRDQRQWSVAECARTFTTSVLELRERYKARAEDGGLVWDKDDNSMMDFVAAAANLRCHVFQMALKTRFEIKSMAGNIIPAIATTNAIVAAIIVLQALKVLNKKQEECRAVYLRRQPNVNKKILVPTDLPMVNPKCYVCSEGRECYLRCRADRLLVRDLRDRVLKKELGMVEPDVEIDGRATILITSEEDCMEESVLNKTLSEFNIGDSTRLRCDDFLQQYNLNLIVIDSPDLPEDQDFQLTGDLDELRASARQEDSNGVSSEKREAEPTQSGVDVEDEEIVITETIGVGQEEMEVLDSAPKKRKLENNDTPIQSKRTRQDDEDNGDAVIVL